MKINKRGVLIQAIGLIVFCVMAAASSSQKYSGSGSDWNEIARGAAVGAAAGYNGYVIVGTASSESEAKSLAASKGYEYYIWDSNNGAVYAQ